MRPLTLVRSTLGRVVRVTVGLSLVVYGATHPSLLGLVLMMVGMVPTITGLAGICLLDGTRDRHPSSDAPGHRRERRA
jgi:hypothetical protein